jgi:hypothetical protein
MVQKSLLDVFAGIDGIQDEEAQIAAMYEELNSWCKALFADRRLLILLSQKVAFWELGILDNFGRFVFRHEELRWITQ